MPRNPSEFPNPPDQPIPDLTSENGAEMVSEPDHITVSFQAKEPREILDSTHPGKITLQRHKYMWHEFYNTEFKGEVDDFGSTDTCGQTRHAFFYDVSDTLVERINSFFDRMLPLWKSVAISFCWTDHSHPRVNTLVYQLEDQMPPDPQTPAFERETGIDATQDTLPEEDIKTVIEMRDAYWDFKDTPDNPRYSYGLTHVLNGDYGAGGADLTAYAWEHLNIDLRYLPASKNKSGEHRFPTTGATPFYEDLVEFVTDYPDHIGVETIDDRTLLTQSETPAPLIPEKPN